MDLIHLLNFQIWADKAIEVALQKVSDEDFNRDNGKIRSLKQLIAHYITSYDYLIVPHNKLQERIDHLNTMGREELLKEWNASQKEFYKQAQEQEDEISLPIGEQKSVTIGRDNYILLYTDHLTYHRGQITQTMKLLGYAGVNTDYYSFAAQL